MQGHRFRQWWCRYLLKLYLLKAIFPKAVSLPGVYQIVMSASVHQKILIVKLVKLITIYDTLKQNATSNEKEQTVSVYNNMDLLKVDGEFKNCSNEIIYIFLSALIFF